MTKASGCEALLSMWGLGWSDALAIGDGANDVPMLAAAAGGGGVSVAMGNAAGSVRAAADHVVGANGDGGWVDAMERFVLARL